MTSLFSSTSRSSTSEDSAPPEDRTVTPPSSSDSFSDDEVEPAESFDCSADAFGVAVSESRVACDVRLADGFGEETAVSPDG
jgi:hypothetical protein